MNRRVNLSEYDVLSILSLILLICFPIGYVEIPLTTHPITTQIVFRVHLFYSGPFREILHGFIISESDYTSYEALLGYSPSWPFILSLIWLTLGIIQSVNLSTVSRKRKMIDLGLLLFGVTFLFQILSPFMIIPLWEFQNTHPAFWRDGPTIFVMNVLPIIPILIGFRHMYRRGMNR